MSGSELDGLQHQAPIPPEVEQLKVGDLGLPSKEPEQDKTGDMTLPATTETDEKEKEEHREVPSIPPPTMEENFENAEPLSTNNPSKNTDVILTIKTDEVILGNGETNSNKTNDEKIPDKTWSSVSNSSFK